METEGATMAIDGSPIAEPSSPTEVAEGTTPTGTVDPKGQVAEPAETKPYDWYDPSTWGDRQPADVMKEVQKQINAKSESEKSLKSRIEQLETAQQQFLREAEMVLRSPELIKQYQQKMGIVPQSLETLPPQPDATAQLPMVELSPDMSITEAQDRFNRALQERDKFHTEYTKKVVNETLEMYKKELYKELNQSLAPMHKSKWKSAMETAESTYGPEFLKVRGQLVNYIDGPYANQYNGENEAQLIDKVFRAEFPDKYEKFIASKYAKNAENLGNAATATPSRSVATLPTDSSDASCIARANARVEAALRAKGLK